MSALKTSLFTDHCECFDDIKFEYPLFYDEENIEQYADEETKKIDEYYRQVLNHTAQNPESVQTKQCYRKDHTNGLVVLKSYKKHRKTLNNLKKVLKEVKEVHHVKLVSGRVIKASEFLTLYDQTITNQICTLRWETLFNHPSEIVRLDEQIRLKTEELEKMRKEIIDKSGYIEMLIDKHVNILIKFRCYLYIEGTKYFQTQLLCQKQFDDLVKSSCRPLLFNDLHQFKFSNTNENEMDLFLSLSADIKNTEDIFRKAIFRFLTENHSNKSFSEKVNMVDIIMSKCNFSLE